jgi:tRNA(Ile)-lysidine synthase
LEEAARLLRYEALNKLAAEQELPVVAVAHNLDDNAETLLMNILRGSGLEGLTGIKARRGNLVRPLLNISREEIETFCRRHNIAYRTDSSNGDTRYLRNKVRLELFPILREYNRNIAASLAHLGKTLARDADFLKKAAANFYIGAADRRGGAVLLPLDKMRGLPQALLSRVILLAVKEQLGGKSFVYITHKHVESVLDLVLEGRTGAVLELPGALTVKRDYLHIAFTAAPPDSRPVLAEEYVLTVPGRVVLQDNRILRASVFRGAQPGAVGKNKAVFPASVARDGLIVRGRRSGDMFRPAGMEGAGCKLKKFLIDHKVPQTERDNIPLVLDKEGVLWVAGVRGAFRQTEEEVKQWLYLELLDKEYIHA